MEALCRTSVASSTCWYHISHLKAYQHGSWKRARVAVLATYHTLGPKKANTWLQHMVRNLDLPTWKTSCSTLPLFYLLNVHVSFQSSLNTPSCLRWNSEGSSQSAPDFRGGCTFGEIPNQTVRTANQRQAERNYLELTQTISWGDL